MESACPPFVTMGFLWLSHINHKYSRVGKKRASNLPFETECLSVHHLTVYWCMSHLRPIVAQISHFTLRADLWLYPLVCQLQPLKCFHDLIPTTKDLTIGSRVQNDKSNTRDWSKTPLWTWPLEKSFILVTAVKHIHSMSAYILLHCLTASSDKEKMQQQYLI